MAHLHLTDGGYQKCDVPLIKECIVNQEKKLRTDLYEPNNTTWNSITWSPEMVTKITRE